MIERSAGEIFVDFEKSAIEMLICMKSMVERNADEIFV